MWRLRSSMTRVAALWRWPRARRWASRRHRRHDPRLRCNRPGGGCVITLTKVLYTAVATAEGGRDGHTATDDGRLDVKVTPPPELGGAAESVDTNPEQLFAAGYSSCFHSALKLVAQRMKLDPEGSTVTARVGIGPIEGSPGFGLAVELDVSLPNVSYEV